MSELNAPKLESSQKSPPLSGDAAALLVVDDNPLVLNVLKSLFQAQEYQVYSCSNGLEALDLVKSKQLDVIICDVMMPKMDGYRFHEQVRKIPECVHIPFVFLTSLSESEQVRKGKETGADDYLIKPFNPDELLSVIKGKIRRSRSLRHLSDEQYDAYRRRVIHTLSHEFRTPLVAINTGTELLIEQGAKLEADKAQHLLEAVRRGGQRLEHLVSDFMLLQQIEAGLAKRLFQTRASEEPLGLFVATHLDEQRGMLERERFTVSFADNSAGSKARIFRPQIADILTRFISNAVKFSAGQRELDLEVYTVQSFIHVEVRDRGIGLSPARVKEAIDVFGQLDRERLEQQGGGLGLAIANRYAAIHGGHLEFDHNEGGGSVVTLILPCAL